MFPGNTWEGHTLKVAIEALEKRFDITRIMVVADAGMLSKDNQKMLGDKGLPYILGYRMRSAPAAFKARILSKEGAQPWSGHGPDDKSEEGWYKVIEHEGSRIIVTYSPTRARNDAHKRDKAIEKLQKKLKRSRKPASFSSRGYGRFLSFPDTGDVTIDEALIKDAAKWDGLHAILIHGADDLDVLDVIARYHQLWEIEACFRTNKHDLKIRPIYHWTPQRVRAHIAIFCMAFCLIIGMQGSPTFSAQFGSHCGTEGQLGGAAAGPARSPRRKSTLLAVPSLLDEKECSMKRSFYNK